jgi:hypothetical protein
MAMYAKNPVHTCRTALRVLGTWYGATSVSQDREGAVAFEVEVEIEMLVLLRERS